VILIFASGAFDSQIYTFFVYVFVLSVESVTSSFTLYIPASLYLCDDCDFLPLTVDPSQKSHAKTFASGEVHSK
jgi:hypothetical protein